jgi:stage II sporulation protein AA (anti-sigma F factor antagonist)
MALHSHPPLVELEQVGAATVARLARSDLLDDKTINALANQLLHLVQERNCRLLILNFKNVERLASAFLGKIIGVHKKLQAEGGRLALCDVDPKLKDAFETLQLHRLFRIFNEEQEALQSMQ